MKNFIRIILFLIVTFGIFITVFSHGDEKHNNKNNTIKVESNLDKEILDSIYNLINEKMVDIEPIFQKSCYDCHSDKTVYPWYYKLPIVKGIIDDDIKDAKKHIDMSNGFPFAGHGKPVDDLAAIRDEIIEEEMPPFKYRMLHWGTLPNDEEAKKIIEWVEFGLEKLEEINIYPSESEDE